MRKLEIVVVCEGCSGDKTINYRTAVYPDGDVYPATKKHHMQRSCQEETIRVWKDKCIYCDGTGKRTITQECIAYKEVDGG